MSAWRDRVGDLTLFVVLKGGAFDRLNWQHSGEFDQNFSKNSMPRDLRGRGDGWFWNWPVHNAKVWVFVDRFCSHFNALGFTNRSKSWIQRRSNNVNYHFCLLSPYSCFKSVTVVKTYLKAISAPDLHVLAVVKGENLLDQKVLRTLYSVILHSVAT